MNFKEWLLIENTISQELKQKHKELTEKLLKPVTDYVMKATEGVLSKDAWQTLSKWYIFNYIKWLGEDSDSVENYRMFFYHAGSPTIDAHVDYILSKMDASGNLEGRFKSQLNDPSFTVQKLTDAVELWHRSMESKTRIQGAKGKVLIDLSRPIEPTNITLLGGGWAGWSWVDLEKNYCEIEGKSMEHCGNVARGESNTILSLRDENNIPHLTFILNVDNGRLGEMKGRKNNKPSKQYHPAIVELLKHPMVKQVFGGGYRPENNFQLDDLDDEIKEELLEFKPDLQFDVFEDLEEKMKEIRERYKTNEWKFAYENCEVENYEGEAVINLYGGFSLEIKDRLLKQYWNADWWKNPQRKNDMYRIKNNIKDELRRRMSLEDLEIEEENGILTIRAQMSIDSHYGGPIDAFDSFIHELDTEVEANEEEIRSLIKRILAEEGFIPNYYVMRAAKEDGKITWSHQKFKNFDWNVNDPKFGEYHEISVKIIDNMKLGKIKNKDPKNVSITQNSELSGVQASIKNKEFGNNVQKFLKDELNNVSKEFWNKESKQKLLFGKQKNAPYTFDMKVQPEFYAYINAEAEDYSKPWGTIENPITAWNIVVNCYIEISQMNTFEEGQEAERLLHFIDNNYELIKSRLLKRFQTEAKKMGLELAS